MGRRHRDPTGGHYLLRDLLDFGTGDVPRSLVGPLLGERDRLARRATELDIALTRLDRAEKAALSDRARRAEMQLENADTVWRGRYEHLSGVHLRQSRALSAHQARADLFEARAARAERALRRFGIDQEPEPVALYDTQDHADAPLGADATTDAAGAPPGGAG